MGHIVDNVLDVGSLYFLSVRFKTVTRSVTFFGKKKEKTDAILENHTCCLPEMILQRRKSCS